MKESRFQGEASEDKSRSQTKKGAEFDYARDKRASEATPPAGELVSAANVTESVKGLATQAGEKLLDMAETEKKAGADFAGGMASAIRRAANEFDAEVPQAAQYIRSAADQIDSVSRAFRERDVNQLINDVQDFARRQPTAFLGATVIAGFIAIRFLKSSTSGASRSFSGGSGQRVSR